MLNVYVTCMIIIMLIYVWFTWTNSKFIEGFKDATDDKKKDDDKKPSDFSNNNVKTSSQSSQVSLMDLKELAWVPKDVREFYNNQILTIYIAKVGGKLSKAWEAYDSKQKETLMKNIAKVGEAISADGSTKITQSDVHQLLNAINQGLEQYMKK